MRRVVLLRSLLFLFGLEAPSHGRSELKLVLMLCLQGLEVGQG